MRYGFFRIVPISGATQVRNLPKLQITIRAIDEKNKRTVCRGSLAREGGSLESYWRPAPREFKSPPRRMNNDL